MNWNFNDEYKQSHYTIYILQLKVRNIKQNLQVRQLQNGRLAIYLK